MFSFGSLIIISAIFSPLTKTTLLNTFPHFQSVEISANDTEEKVFDEIFRDDDDMSPFWCRIFAEEDGYGDNTEENFNRLLHTINKNNKLL